MSIGSATAEIERASFWGQTRYTQPKHKHAPIVNATGCRLRKGRLRMPQRCNTLRVMQVAFYQSESEQPHPSRARAIIKAHPEVRELMVRNPWTALIAVSILLVQTALAFGMGQLGFGYWGQSLLFAFCMRALVTHPHHHI